MPLEDQEDFGTTLDGSRSEDYCCFCYQDGRFTEPDITMDGMIDKCVAVLVEHNVMPESQARAILTKFIPRLKRWQKPM